MKRLAITLLAVASCSLSVLAQPPGGRGGNRGGGFGGPEGGPRSSPMMEALDADHDGVISATEINNATAALKKLDKNGDGRLTDDEVRPPRPDEGRGRGEAGNPGPRDRGPGGGARGQDGDRGPGGDRGPRDRGAGGGDQERRGPGGPGGGQTVSFNPERMLAHAMEFDADKDEKLNKTELQTFFADFVKQHGGDQARRGGGRGGRSNGGGGRPESGGDRPDRPQRPQRPE